MSFEYFFTYSEQIKERGLDIGFDLYSPKHLMWLIAGLIMTVVIATFYRRCAAGTKQTVKKLFALALLASEVIKDAVMMVLGAPMIGYLPFHLCSFAIAALLMDAWGCLDKVIKQMMAYAFFPGAVAALLFCNWTEYPMLSFMNIHSFTFHIWIVFYFIMIYCAGEVKPSYKGIWQSIAVLLITAVPVYIFNLVFDTNYLFLNEASAGSPLVAVWDIFGTRFGQAGYVAGVLLLVTVVFHALYALYRLLDKFFAEKRGVRDDI